MDKKFTISVTVPEGLTAGDTFEVEVAVPGKDKARGQLAGIAIADMTDEQLKREIINANSVLYKATKRGAPAETIAANQARLDAAKAEKAKRHPVVETADAATEEVVEEGVYSDETAAEV